LYSKENQNGKRKNKKTKIIDIIQHPGFLESVRKQLKEIHQKRKKLRLASNTGLKRSAIDTLEELKVTPESYPALYLEILLKKSQLSSRERGLIKRIGDIALIDTMKNHFQDHGKSLQQL
jgi:hypothetical protein